MCIPTIAAPRGSWRRDGLPGPRPPEEFAIAAGSFEAMRTGAGPLDRWLVLPMLKAVGHRRRKALLHRSSFADEARPAGPADFAFLLHGWLAIPTPGHTVGHASFLRPADRVLISGDAVVTLAVNSPTGLLRGRRGLSGPPWYTTWNARLSRASIARLADLEPRILASGHGPTQLGAATPAALRTVAVRLTRNGG
jgi:glyoxylase-like metal-dependent hydrolase (beta-lactamase superfamily II)